MTTLLLIRHAQCDPIGHSIAGRTPGIHLSATGCAEAAELARHLAAVPIAAVYSSPLERAVETAEPLAQSRGLQVQKCEGLNELDFGEWTGRTLAQLDSLPIWRAFNLYRSGTRIPGGETMMEVVSRGLTSLAAIASDHSGEVVAAVSHGDLIRGVVAHYAAMPIDLFQRLEISPASVTAVRLEEWGPKLLVLNWRPSLTL